MAGGCGVEAGGQAAFLELLPAAARTGIVAADIAEGIAFGREQLRRQIPFALVVGRRIPIGLVVGLCFRLETMPTRQFRNGIAEQSEVAVGARRFGIGVLDRMMQVLFESPRT